MFPYRRICRNRRNFLPKTYAMWQKTSCDIGAQYKGGSQYRRNFFAKNFRRYRRPVQRGLPISSKFFRKKLSAILGLPVVHKFYFICISQIFLDGNLKVRRSFNRFSIFEDHSNRFFRKLIYLL
jgi:hypothetical protein